MTLHLVHEPITCVVADDHPAVLRSVGLSLERNGLAVVGTATDGLTALALVQEHQPRVCVADLHMPGLDGLSLARDVREAELETRVLIFSGAEEPRLCADALEAGAFGVALKSAPLGDLVRAIGVVDSGHFYVDPLLAVENLRPGNASGLSSRESEILMLLADGRSYGDIASSLAISSETVRTHAKHAKKKLGARTRTEAVAIALRTALIA
jgi:two-component system response regulator DesR